MSNETDQQKLVEKWNKTASDLLVGLQVERAYYMPRKSTDQMNWHASPLVIKLVDPKDKTKSIHLFPMSDDEGNEAGALATSADEEPVMPVIWNN